MHKYINKILLLGLLFLSIYIIPVIHASESSMLIDFESSLDNSTDVKLYGNVEIKDGGRNEKYASLQKNNCSYISINTDLIHSSTELSIMFWIKLDKIPSNYARIIDFGLFDEGVKQFIALYYLNGELYFVVSNNFPNQKAYKLSSSFPIGGWSQFACTISSDGIANIYINEECVLSQNMGCKLSDFSCNKAFIGKSLFNGDPYLSCGIDDLYIVNKQLNLDDIITKVGINNNEAILGDLESIDIPKTITGSQIEIKKVGDNGTVLKWEFSNDSLITDDGYIMRTSNLEDPIDLQIIITGTRNKQMKNVTINTKIMPIKVDTKYNNVLSENVSLISSLYTKYRDVNKQYMDSLDIDRLLYNFRSVAGIENKVEEYGGWIKHDIGAGNFEPHYLSALSFIYNEKKSTDDFKKIKYFVDSLKECQDQYAINHPSDAGYLSAIKIDMFEQLEATGTCYWPVYYNLEKIISCLYDVYVYAKYEPAYDVLLNLCDWTSKRINNYSNIELQNVFSREYGGIAYILIKTYLLTGKQDYLVAGLKFFDDSLYDDLAKGKDPFNYIHSNTVIPKILASTYAYMATGDEYYLTIAINAYELITDGRCYATGGTSQCEEWPLAHELENESFMTQETCCSYNMLRLADMLFKITGEKKYADYYEKTFINSIMSSMDIDSGMKTYNVSMGSGYYKIYHTPEDSFWCCTATGVENFTKMNQNIYYENENDLVINQFISSTYKQENIDLTLNSGFPNNFTNEIRINKINKRLLVRLPKWSTNNKLTINGEINKNPLIEDGYMVLENLKPGDIIKIFFTPDYYLEKLDNINDNKHTIFYGPLLLAGVIDNIGEVTPFQNNSMAGKLASDRVVNELFYKGNFLYLISKIDEHHFKINCENQTVILKPFFEINRDSYIIYWNIYEQNSEEFYNYINKVNIKNSYNLDEIDCGNWFSESVHDMKQINSSIGNYATEHCRGVEEGGSVEYTMAVEKGVQNSLFIRHFGKDSGYGYSIYINGEYVDKHDIEGKGRKFYELETLIPMKYTNDRDFIQVKVVVNYGRAVTGFYKFKTKRSGLALYTEYSMDFKSGGTKIASFGSEILVDKMILELSNSCDFDVYTSSDGFKYLKESYEVLENTEEKYQVVINKLFQLKNIKIVNKSSNPVHIKLSVYGGKIDHIEPITQYSFTGSERITFNNPIKVFVENGGSFKMRINSSLFDPINNKNIKLYFINKNVDLIFSQKEIDDDLIAYYDFESINENEYEIIGNHNAVSGKEGLGVNLEGTSYIKLKSLENVLELTISMWVKFNNTQDILYQRLFDFGNDKDNCLFFTPSMYASGNINNIKNVVSDKVYYLQNSKWYNYTITINDGIATTYLDGVKISQNKNFNYDLNVLQTYQNLYIGNSNTRYVPMLNAVVDEVRIYNYGLSDEQVMFLSSLNK